MYMYINVFLCNYMVSDSFIYVSLFDQLLSVWCWR